MVKLEMGLVGDDEDFFERVFLVLKIDIVCALHKENKDLVFCEKLEYFIFRGTFYAIEIGFGLILPVFKGHIISAYFELNY